MGGLGRIICEVLGPEILVLLSTPREEVWHFVLLAQAGFPPGVPELFLTCEWNPELPLLNNLFKISLLPQSSLIPLSLSSTVSIAHCVPQFFPTPGLRTCCSFDLPPQPLSWPAPSSSSGLRINGAFLGPPCTLICLRLSWYSVVCHHSTYPKL